MILDTIIFSTTTNCNLNCIYCQNEPAFEKTVNTQIGIDIIEKIISELVAMTKNKCKEIRFCFAGGEPLLMGFNYFDNILKLQNKYNSENLRIVNVIQTNGTLINYEWASFFKENDIQISVSIDGPGNIQNHQRKLNDPQTTCMEKVISGVSNLIFKQVRFGTLTVVTKHNMHYAAEIFDFLKTMKPNMMGFLPCVDRGPYISAEEYGTFMINLYDKWIENNDPSVNIREFRHVILSLLNAPHKVGCQYSGDCPRHINITPDGFVHVCDQFIGKKRGLLGNITENTLQEIITSQAFTSFREQTHNKPEKCQRCNYLKICNGGCAYRRMTSDNIDYLCKSRKMFIGHIDKSLTSEIRDIVSAIPEKLTADTI